MSRPDPSSLSHNNVVAFIGDIFARRGAESYLGEAVTMSQHMLQAALLAEEAGEPDAVIAAALLHDVGHFTSEFPEDAQDHGIDNRHDQAGAAVLEHYFPPEVVACVGGHVAAKRYLCATDPTYLAQLSPASLHTLDLQGGPMSPEECADFASRPHLDATLRVRRYDDAGKCAQRSTPSFNHHVRRLQRLVDATRDD